MVSSHQKPVKYFNHATLQWLSNATLTSKLDVMRTRFRSLGLVYLAAASATEPLHHHLLSRYHLGQHRTLKARRYLWQKFCSFTVKIPSLSKDCSRYGTQNRNWQQAAEGYFTFSSDLWQSKAKKPRITTWSGPSKYLSAAESLKKQPYNFATTFSTVLFRISVWTKPVCALLLHLKKFAFDWQLNASTAKF